MNSYIYHSKLVEICIRQTTILFIGVFFSTITTFAQRADSVVTFNEIQYHPLESNEPEWVELHNQMAVRVDVSGWQIKGGIDFTFSENSIIEPGAYWIIASNPEHDSFTDDVITNGPFSGKLSNSGESIILLDRHGRVMDEFEYGDSGNWPCAADGIGPTLAKWNPDAASGRPSNWTWSQSTSGSPGKLNFEGESILKQPRNGYSSVQANRVINRSGLRLSEIAAANDPEFFIEVENMGTEALDLDNFSINGVLLPEENLAAGGFQTYSSADLNLSVTEGDILFITTSSGIIADTVRIKNQLRAFDSDRSIWQYPDTATPGAANFFNYDTRVIINEINYHNRPVFSDPENDIRFAESDVEWIELHNRSEDIVDLSDWIILDAIEHEFSNGTTITPGGFLVIDQSEYSNSLNNSRDRIQLLDPMGNIADIVEYFDRSPWPRDADGRGSSLELSHPDSDNSDPAAWRASDESSKSNWKSFSYRGAGIEPARNKNPDYFHEFLMGMLDRGEVLVDDISVIEDPDGAAIELMQNGDFEMDAPGEAPLLWRILGNHQNSHVVALAEGGQALKLITSGQLEHSYNIASTTLVDGKSVDPDKTYQISFRAKWISGSPQLNTRLYFNKLARTHILPQPTETGTPGIANSTLISKVLPGFSQFSHTPLVPVENEAVNIHATLTSPEGIAKATLHYNAGSGWSTLPMVHEPESDNYSGTIPGQVDGSIVQFYIEATSNSGATSSYPEGGINSRALFRVGDRMNSNGKTQLLRLILLPEEADFMHIPNHVVSNHRYGATVVYNDSEVWYNVGIHLRGSPYGRSSIRLGWNIKFPADKLFRGVHKTIAVDGGYSIPIGDGTAFIEIGGGIATNELIYNQMAKRAGGIPSSYDDVVNVEAPRPRDDKLAQLKMARFGNIWKASSFENGDEGTSYELEIIYHPTTTIDGNTQSMKSPYGGVLGLSSFDLGHDKEAYRHNFLIKNNTLKDDYSAIIATGAALNNSENLYTATEEAMDVDNWLRVMALQALTTTIDSYNNRGFAHNMVIYERPSDHKTMWIPWDVDHAFFEPPTYSIYGGRNREFADVVRLPINHRNYCGHLLDLCNTGFNPSYISTWITHFNDVSKQPLAERYHQWISDRRTFVLAQLQKKYPFKAFQITSNNGSDFIHDYPMIALRGNGWIDVNEIRIEETGQVISPQWISDDTWEINLQLEVGKNIITLSAFDISGVKVGDDRINIENTSTFVLPSSSNLVISEIMYHPADASVWEKNAGYTDEDSFEYLELQNIGIDPVRVSGIQFTEGINFDFSDAAITEIPRGQTALVVRNLEAFEFRNGSGLPVAGAFQNDTGLSNGGERIYLIDESGNSIQNFSYDDKKPWPEEPDGEGNSLTLLNPFTNPDPDKASSWGISDFKGGNPGEIEKNPFTGNFEEDDDHDGMSNFMNYALGGSGSEFLPILNLSSEQSTFSHRLNLSASNIQWEIEFSSDLKNWVPLEITLEDETECGDGTSELFWKLPESFERYFLRLKAIDSRK